jgi:DNA-binding YbaB/EbfC family protein
MKDLGKMFKEVQRMQQEMAKIQDQLAEEKVEASAGGGMVKVIANGQQELLKVVIDSRACTPDDVEILQDMVLTAVNNALQQSKDLAAQQLSKLTGGVNIPGLF